MPSWVLGSFRCADPASYRSIVLAAPKVDKSGIEKNKIFVQSFIFYVNLTAPDGGITSQKWSSATCGNREVEVTNTRGLMMPRLFAAFAFAYCLFISSAVAQVLPPSPPVATVATNVGQTSFAANWNASATSTSYLVQVATDPIFRLIVTGYNNVNVGNVLTLDVTGLSPATTYYYRVRASNAGGTSGASNVITVTTVVATPPAPVAFPATNVRQTSFTANWDTSAGATLYLLDVSTDTGFSAIVPGYGNLNAGNVQTLNVLGITPGTKYFYRLRGSNVGGTSGNSNIISVTTVVATPPPPVAVAGTIVTQTSFTANWNSSVGATTYFLDVATDTNFAAIISADSNLNVGNVLTRNITGLAAGTKYFYRVRGSNVGGTSGNSNTMVVTTVAATPTAPVAIPASNIVQTSFTANWNASAGATAYLLDVASDTSFTALIPGYNNLNVGNVLTRNVTGLTPAAKYFYRVRGSNVGGTSGNSNSILVTTLVATPPPPVAVAGTIVTQTSFTANWNSSVGATAYFLDVATDTNFTVIISADSNLNVGNVLTRNITGLAAGTKYFYRVRASNVGGTSGNSNTIVVTTVVATPLPPVATPASGIGPASFSANWNASAGATTYLIDVATDTGFTSTVPGYGNLNLGNVLTRNVVGLASTTKYFYRVRGSNVGGTSGNSNIVSLTTIGVPPPPPVPTAPVNGSIGQPVALTLAWNASPTASSYVVQVSTAASFALPFISDTAVSGTSRPVSGLAPNTIYFWRVAGKNQFGAGAFSSPAFLFSTVDTAAVTGTVPFPVNPAQSDYRMVSVPGIVPGSVSDLTAGSGGEQKFDWRAFRMPDSGVLTELGPQDQIGIGEGIWLIRKNTLSIKKSAAMPGVQANGAFPILIHSGWNIIADPFDVPVQWAAVRTLNSLVPADVIQGWSGSYAVDTVMEPLKGYYFFSNSPELTTLAIPYPLPSTQPPPANVLSPVTWSLQVAFESADNNDADCRLGIAPAAMRGHDSLEIRKPPLAFAGGEVYFTRPETGGKYARFSTDYRPAVNGSEEWDIQISRPNGCNGTLRFNGVDDIPANYSVILLAPDNGWPTNLRSQREYCLKTTLTNLTVRVLVGVDSVVAHRITALVPDSYMLNQNYPNPFNPSTTIRYGLPQRSTVSLTVFNALGQRVRQLVNEEQEAGYHEVKFDGTGLASGVYFYRLRAGGFVETKKFLFLQ